MAAEVGARGFVAESLSKAAKLILRIRGRPLRKLTRGGGGGFALFKMALLDEWEEGMGIQGCELMRSAS